MSNPCLNNGQCIQYGANLAYCNCSHGYTGLVCETPSIKSSTQITYQFLSSSSSTTASAKCSEGYCFNSGACYVDGLALGCYCTPKYTGTRCENYIDPCLAVGNTSICENNGVCSVDLTKSPPYTCTCQAGWTGSDCEISKSVICSP